MVVSREGHYGLRLMVKGGLDGEDDMEETGVGIKHDG